jgi:hypothetical protein
MPTYNVTASATAGPLNVGLKIDGQRMPISHDADGNWIMSGTAVSSKNPIPYEFRAIGISTSKTTLKIALKAQDGSGSGSVSPDPLVIPDNGLLISPGTIAITKVASPRILGDLFDIDGNQKGAS